jgi:hypothetical protein
MPHNRKPLAWGQIPDGEHNGRPTYDYRATSGDRTYHVTWAYDAGFGYTARDAKGYIHGHYSIVWARTLRACKARCEEIEKNYDGPAPTVD